MRVVSGGAGHTIFISLVSGGALAQPVSANTTRMTSSAATRGRSNAPGALWMWTFTMPPLVAAPKLPAPAVRALTHVNGFRARNYAASKALRDARSGPLDRDV